MRRSVLSDRLIRAAAISLTIHHWVVSPAIAGFDEGLYAYSLGNYEDAAREFAVAAQRGETQGEYYLGLLYEEGQGLERNYELALRWYLKAAVKGDVDAAFALGRMHAKGLGIQRDLPAAYMWYSRAAKGGHYLGQQEQEKCAGLMSPAELDRAETLARQ